MCGRRDLRPVMKVGKVVSSQMCLAALCSSLKEARLDDGGR